MEYQMSIFNAWVKEGAEQQKTTQLQHQKTKKKSSQEEAGNSIKCHIP